MKIFVAGCDNHHLGQPVVDVIDLGLALEAKDNWVAALAVFGDGGVKLREPLKAGQLVDHKPNLFLPGFRLAEKAQDE